MYTDHYSMILWNKVHLVDKAKYFGIWRTLEDSLKTQLIVLHVLLLLTTLTIKHINENIDTNEYLLHLERFRAIEKFSAEKIKKKLTPVDGYVTV